MNIKMTSDLILIRRITNQAPTTSWGFQMPAVEESHDTPWRGEVVAVGPGKWAKMTGAGQKIVDALKAIQEAYRKMPNIDWGVRGFPLALFQGAADALQDADGMMTRIPMQVQVGDVVIFSKNLFQEFKLDGEVLIATHEDSILGVIDSKPVEGA